MFYTIRRFAANMGIALGTTAVITASKDVHPGAAFRRRAVLQVAMQIVLTLGAVALGTYLLTGPGLGDKEREYGSGLWGIVLGYWLR